MAQKNIGSPGVKVIPIAHRPDTAVKVKVGTSYAPIPTPSGAKVANTLPKEAK